MATIEQKKLVANTLIDLAHGVRRTASADFVAWLNDKTPEWKRTLADALIATDVQVAFDAILGIRYGYASDPTAAAATSPGGPDDGPEWYDPRGHGTDGGEGRPHLDAERMGFAIEFESSPS